MQHDLIMHALNEYVAFKPLILYLVHEVATILLKTELFINKFFFVINIRIYDMFYIGKLCIQYIISI